MENMGTYVAKPGNIDGKTRETSENTQQNQGEYGQICGKTRETM